MCTTWTTPCYTWHICTYAQAAGSMIAVDGMHIEDENLVVGDVQQHANCEAAQRMHRALSQVVHSKGKLSTLPPLLTSPTPRLLQDSAATESSGGCSEKASSVTITGTTQRDHPHLLRALRPDNTIGTCFTPVLFATTVLNSNFNPAPCECP